MVTGVVFAAEVFEVAEPQLELTEAVAAAGVGALLSLLQTQMWATLQRQRRRQQRLQLATVAYRPI